MGEVGLGKATPVLQAVEGFTVGAPGFVSGSAIYCPRALG